MNINRRAVLLPLCLWAMSCGGEAPNPCTAAALRIEECFGGERPPLTSCDPGAAQQIAETSCEELAERTPDTAKADLSWSDWWKCQFGDQAACAIDDWSLKLKFIDSVTHEPVFAMGVRLFASDSTWGIAGRTGTVAGSIQYNGLSRNYYYLKVGYDNIRYTRDLDKWAWCGVKIMRPTDGSRFKERTFVVERNDRVRTCYLAPTP